jgi:hypothetical protein
MSADERLEIERQTAVAIRTSIQAEWRKDKHRQYTLDQNGRDVYTTVGQAWNSCFEVANLAAHKGVVCPCDTDSDEMCEDSFCPCPECNRE